MSWGQYLLLQRGYWQKQNRAWEDSWKQTRELYWILFNANVKSEDQQSRHELMPLPSDADTGVTKKQSKEAATIDFFQAMAVFDVSEN